MNERYTRLAVLPNDLYLAGSPVLLAAGALLKDNVNDTVLVQLKLRNLYHVPLVACKVQIRAFDPSGAEITGVESFSYLDLKAACGVDFGAQTPIHLPDKSTRQFSACVIQAVFENGTVWEHEAAEWTQPSLRFERIEDRFLDEELQKQYSLEVGGDGKFVPETNDGLFLCTCGTLNLASEKECFSCHREQTAVVAALDIAMLTQKKNQRLIAEQAERERIEEEEKRLAAERAIAEQKRQEEIAAHKKRIKKLVKLVAPAAVLVIVFTLVLTQVILPASQYKDAEKLLAAGDYIGAARSFFELGNYKDSAEKYADCFAQCSLQKSLQYPLTCGESFTVGLNADGTVVATGYNSFGQCNVSSWKDIIALAAGSSHTVGLKTDGTVIAIGSNGSGQCDVSDWENIVAIAASPYNTVGLKSDGTVVVVGSDMYGQTDVSEWQGIIAISAGASFNVGLRIDGTVIAAGSNYAGQCNVSDWKDIIAIAAGSGHIVGLKSDGTVVAVGRNEEGQCNVSDWEDIVAIAAGSWHTVGLKSDGTVVAVGEAAYSKCNVSNWKDIVAIAAGREHTIGLKADGTVVSIGYNTSGQCDVYGWNNIKMPSRVSGEEL